MGNEFWAAIVGAIVGGIVAALIQYMSLRHQTSEEKKRQRERDQALGRGLIFKLMRLVSDLHNIDDHLSSSKSRAEPQMKAEPWLYVVPIANLPDRIKVSSEEASLVLGQNNDVLNDLLDLEVIHGGALQAMKLYGDLRQALTEKLPHSTFQGSVETLELPVEQMAPLRPRMIELNSIIDALHLRSKADFDLAIKTLTGVSQILAERYDLKLKLEISPTKSSESTRKQTLLSEQ